MNWILRLAMIDLTTRTVLEMRLTNQHLASSRLDEPGLLVAHLGAVHAQDFGAAKWAVGQRLRSATDASIELERLAIAAPGGDPGPDVKSS